MLNLTQVSSTLLYFSILPCLFFSIYWGKTGIYLGIACAFLFLFGFVFFARKQIERKMRWTGLPYEKAPYVHEELRRFAHYLGVPLPRVWLVKRDTLNAGVFGFTKRTRHLFLTAGCLEKLSPAEQSSLMANLMAQHSLSCTNLTAYQFAFLIPLSTLWMKRQKNFWEWIAHSFCLSYLFIPLLLLRSKTSPKAIDERALKMFPYPLVYGSVLRKFNFGPRETPETSVESLVSVRSQKQDALALFLEGESSMLDRIQWIENNVYG